ncbi:hypothetical protein CCACVL1_13447 [Corchorus capsularis]|uniref:Wall-associated receptor kinase galacturonan-binding domain-containing protein n=1 Tax=Corchorus capsularis TaxID=210143 RepID=A0A1R3IAY8_COCAP|nr:hypothetical protein CCACVL1_13447 [Corchorus capsularis]
MACVKAKLFLLFSFLSFLIQPSRSDERCHSETECGSSEPTIHFPFSFSQSQTHCGYPGFTVTCKNETQKIITFPFSGEFKIEDIDYFSQVMRISDPYGCTQGRLLEGFNYSATPFEPSLTQNFTFFNCTPDPSIPIITGINPISCLSSDNYSVVAVPTEESSDFSSLFTCSKMTTILYPTNWQDIAWSVSVANYVTLAWTIPDCRSCVNIGGTCQLKNDDYSTLECVRSAIRSYSHKASICAAVVAASGVCIIGLILCIRRRIKRRLTQSNAETSSILTNNMPRGVLVQWGHDRTVIEHYPTTVVGESLELPKSTDNFCSICLLEYRATEISFPFQLITNQTNNDQSNCGYPGFGISCKNQSQMTLTFPNSGEFSIMYLDYLPQNIWISDPQGCFANRLLQLQGFEFDPSGTPFEIDPLNSFKNFTLLNCSSDAPIFPEGSTYIYCLSDDNNSVLAIPIDRNDLLTSLLSSYNCVKIETLLGPIYNPFEYLRDRIMLTWKEPDCKWCLKNGGTCQFKKHKGFDVGCSISDQGKLPIGVPSQRHLKEYTKLLALFSC